ncbi:MAG TPA: hypothetical protein VFH31_06360 [Pyrinomonadaceae bacterium]|nr:hypothetical protein [Pyrinomonadaceae bacterium]
MGPDYNIHLARLLEWEKIFDFSATSPPTYFLLGHALFRLIGRNNGFVITLSIFQVAMTTVAMWWFFIYTQRRFESPVIHLALVFFLTFLPVRVIHATVIGTDWPTIPLFVLVLFMFDRLLADGISTAKNGALLGLALTLAVGTKYSFMAALPALFVTFTVLWIRRRWGFKRFVAICFLTLILPSALSLYRFWASSRLHGYNTEKHWLPKGVVAEMDYNDLLSVKVEDLELFKVPEMFKRSRQAVNWILLADGIDFTAFRRSVHFNSRYCGNKLNL